jgi:hypothetical protein
LEIIVSFIRLYVTLFFLKRIKVKRIELKETNIIGQIFIEKRLMGLLINS